MKKRSRLIIFDECLKFPEDTEKYSEALLKFKKGTKDKKIISFINSIDFPPVLFFTNNVDHFKNKLEDRHMIASFSKEALKDYTTAVELGILKGTQSTTAQKYKKSRIDTDEKDKRQKSYGTKLH